MDLRMNPIMHLQNLLKRSSKKSPKKSDNESDNDEYKKSDSN